MKFKLIGYFALFLIELSLLSEESFITQQEYGKMLYENPRGIGCNKCHGKKGQGQLLESYIHKKTQKNLIIPPINNLKYKKFEKRMYKKSGIMPKYFLTKEEIQSLFIYLTYDEDNKTLKKDEIGN